MDQPADSTQQVPDSTQQVPDSTQQVPDSTQPKPKTPRMKLNFDNISDENLNEIKSDDQSKDKEELKIDDDAEQSPEMSKKKKKKGFTGRLFAWFGKKKEVIRAKTMKYGARLTKRREDAEVDKSTLGHAVVMAMCGKNEQIDINERM